MHDNQGSLPFPIDKLQYQPEPDTVSGFIAGVSERVDELLAAANWQPQLE